MDRDTWVNKYAGRLKKLLNLSNELSRYCAEIALENLDNDTSFDPLDEADQEAEQWVADAL